MDTNKALTPLHRLRHAYQHAGLTLRTKLGALKWRRIAIWMGIAVTVLAAVYGGSFFWPRGLQFSYAGGNCVTNPVLFPGLVKSEPSQSYNATFADNTTIGGFILYSHTTCVQAKQAPTEHTAENVMLSPLLFGGLFKKTITVNGGAAPTVRSQIGADKPVSSKAPLTFTIDTADEVFSYRLAGNGATTPCSKKDTQLSCNLSPLNLLQATQYELSLERLFNNQPVATVLKTTVTTIAPITVVASTITAGQTIHDAPSGLTLTLSKPVASYQGIRLSTNGQEIPVTHSAKDSTITVQFTQPLPRSAQINLDIQSIEATDKGVTDMPFQLIFYTSGGPKVTGVNIGTYKVSTGASITLTFDAPLASGQDLLHFIKVERDAGQMDASYSLRGNTVTITPRGGMPRCTAFSVKVLDGLKNEAGISGSSGNWQYNSRTICQTVFSIGASVQGRSILAYKFGGGGSTMVFVAGIHGDEKSSTYTMNSFIDHLEANIGSIPANRTIIVIPVANPDGYASGSRYNAHGVDLNRNFPVSNWKPDVTGPDGVYREYGGGNAPLSEPESSALADFINGVGPRLVMSYHAYGQLIAANEAGDSLAVGETYGNQVGYPTYGNDGASNFDYDTTGAFEDWLAEDHNIGCLLIELTTKTGNEFSSHRAAIQTVIRL